MNCDQAQSAIFDFLAAGLPAEQHAQMESHLTGCDFCRSLAATQRQLDDRLASAVRAPDLSPQFRIRLRARLKRTGRWPDYLPDLAHLCGCAVGLGSLLVLLPEHRERVALLGGAFIMVSYFSQAVLRDSEK